jgi:hypothetical protein
MANQQVATSGLQRPPSSIVIDRMYIEAGSTVVGGLNMGMNKVGLLKREYVSTVKVTR